MCFILQDWNLWINSDGAVNKTWLQMAREFSTKGSLILHEDLSEHMDMNGYCLGMMYTNRDPEINSPITLTSWNCNRKNYVVCKLDPSEAVISIKPSKFPCIPDNGTARRKRESETNGKNGLYSIDNTDVNFICNISQF